MNLQNIPRFLLSAIGSGQGKTTVTAALLGAFCTKGIRVQSYKCGPDYIDPMFHESITGTPCYHTDPFFSDEAEMKQLVVKKSRSAQLTILEGAMGFYDGIGGTEQASAYTVSEYLDTPVVLVVSPQGVGCSLAAICRGFQQFRTPNAICGVILNQIRPEMYDYYREILQRETGLSVYGYLPALPQTHLESRHLGLMTAKEVTSLEEKLQLLSKTALKTVHLDALIELAESAPLISSVQNAKKYKKRFRLGVAQDRAFCFYYWENLEILEQYGAEIVPFSPITDSSLPDDLDGLYFGGGYPELYLPQLSSNMSFLENLRKIATQKIPILGECGGFLYLQQCIFDKDGTAFPMAGLLPGTSKLGNRLCRFGYVTLTSQEDTLLGKTGTVLKAHEFHYADSTENGAAFLAERPNGKQWMAIQNTMHITAGFPHVYLPSCPSAAETFSHRCITYRKERNASCCF